MQTDLPLSLFTLLLGLLGVTGLVEHSLYGGFNRFYYTHGLPFVIRRVSVAAGEQDIPTPSELDDRCRSDLIGSLLFQSIAADTYGFRRKFYRWALFPFNLMHGMLLFDRHGNRVVLKGFINAWVALMVLGILVFLAIGPFLWTARLLVLGMLIVLVVLPLLMEARRLVKLADFAASAWTPSVPGGTPPPNTQPK